MFIEFSSLPIPLGQAGPEWILITGPVLIGYLKRLKPVFGRNRPFSRAPKFLGSAASTSAEADNGAML
jgi:hypothetical protein